MMKMIKYPRGAFSFADLKGEAVTIEELLVLR
jgi:hypothetical protein